MKISCVTVCVNYSDFLAHTLPLNKSQFDEYIVVTDKSDIKTKRLCEYHHIRCIQTDIFYQDGAPFAKAKGINVGLKALKNPDWVLHLDADMVLVPQFRNTVQQLNLDKSYIYGCDRLMCESFEDWCQFLLEPDMLQEASIYVHPHHPKFRVGTRIAQYGYPQGYIPIGFFQLWNPSGSGVHVYPQDHTDAGRTDMLFAKLWPRNKRGFLPEVLTIHLESQKLEKMGANWMGRTTSIFGPSNRDIIRVVESESNEIKEVQQEILQEERKDNEIQSLILSALETVIIKLENLLESYGR